jgi:hypothetical protein
MKQIVVQQFLFPAITLQAGGYVMGAPIAFSMTATVDCQTVFTLPYVPSTIICLFIMGIGQNILTGDYTLMGNIVTFNQGIPLGYTVFGALQL